MSAIAAQVREFAVPSPWQHSRTSAVADDIARLREEIQLYKQIETQRASTDEAISELLADEANSDALSALALEKALQKNEMEMCDEIDHILTEELQKSAEMEQVLC